MDVLSIKVDFEKALKRIAKIRFYDWAATKRNFYEQTEQHPVTISPVKAEICKRAKCNAGLDCCHLFKIMGINFCVW